MYVCSHVRITALSPEHMHKGLCIFFASLTYIRTYVCMYVCTVCTSSYALLSLLVSPYWWSMVQLVLYIELHCWRSHDWSRDMLCIHTYVPVSHMTMCVCRYCCSASVLHPAASSCFTVLPSNSGRLPQHCQPAVAQVQTRSCQQPCSACTACGACILCSTVQWMCMWAFSITVRPLLTS